MTEDNKLTRDDVEVIESALLEFAKSYERWKDQNFSDLKVRQTANDQFARIEQARRRLWSQFYRQDGERILNAHQKQEERYDAD